MHASRTGGSSLSLHRTFAGHYNRSLTSYQLGESMNAKSMPTIMWCFLASALIFGQTPAAPQQTGPEKQTVATAIPGVVAAGTKVERVWTGDMSADGLIGMADGTLLLPEQGADRISTVDKN